MNNLRRTFACALVCLIALSVLRAPVAAQDAEPVYDIVIRNGRVLDGAGNPWIAADVAIYASHIRGEGKELIQSIEEAITIGEKGGLPVEVFHLKRPRDTHAA